MAETNPAPAANRSLIGNDDDPAAMGIKTRKQEDPDQQPGGTQQAHHSEGGHPSDAQSSGHTPDQPGFRDAVEMQARAESIETDGEVSLSPERAETTPGGSQP